MGIPPRENSLQKSPYQQINHFYIPKPKETKRKLHKMQFDLKKHKKRFKREKRRLVETFGEFVSFPKIWGETRVEVSSKTSKGNKYKLRCYVGNDLLNSMPDLVVCEPYEPLKDRHGIVLGPSYDNHCYGSDKYGFTMICHCREDRWDHNMNLCQVFIKGLIWLEAYDNNDLPSLPEMPMTEENLERMEKHLRRMGIEPTEIMEDHVSRLMLLLNCQTVDELMQRL